MNQKAPESDRPTPPRLGLTLGGIVGDVLLAMVRTAGLLVLLILGLVLVAPPMLIAAPLVLVGFLVTLPMGGIYRHALTRRYLRRKITPLFAGVGVALSTSMVIIVVGVMGGFLDMLSQAGHKLIGDVSFHAGLNGFPHYEELIREIEKLPEAEAASAMLETGALLKFGNQTRLVFVSGIDGSGQDKVTQYHDTLFWTPQRLKQYPAVASIYGNLDPVAAGVQLKVPWEGVKDFPAMVPGIEVSPANQRQRDGSYAFPFGAMPGAKMVLTVLPITERGGVLEPQTRSFIVVNEFHSNLYEADSKRVFIAFDLLQKMLLMDAAPRIMRNDDGSVRLDADGNPMTDGVEPARCTQIQVRAAAGVTPHQLREKLEKLYEGFLDRYIDLPPTPYMSIATWQERQADFIQTVENEKSLMIVLFAIISLTSVVMIGVIFYTIVLEKTRDIGILRSMGASRFGVAGIFLSFGAVIGTLGAVLGTIVAYGFVTYINEIHDWLGDGLGVGLWLAGFAITFALAGLGIGVWRGWKAGSGMAAGILKWSMGLAGAGAVLAWGILQMNDGLGLRLNEQFSVQIWNRQVYFFEQIPARIDWTEVGLIMLVAVASSVVGSVLPALRAARVNPVESLRYE